MAKKPAAREPEVLPALPEQQLAETDGQTILTFLNGLVPFFRKAQQIEQAAKERLDRARQFTLPKPGDVEGDARLQVFIKECSAEKKAADQHWGITAVFSQVHKRLVGGRDRVTGEPTATKNAGYLVEAQNIAQRLHNTYAEDARRRAVEEQQRLDREERQRQEAQRQADADRLEAEATVREAESADLSTREDRFAGLVATGYKPTDAARVCGYKNHEQMAERLLALPKIANAIQAKRDAIQLREQAKAVKETPVDVQTPTVKPEIQREGSDRTTYTMEIFDPRLLVEAVIGGRHGIPADMLEPSQTRGNAYARDMRELVNRWPGCRLVKKTKTI